MLSAMMIQTYALAQQQSGAWSCEPETASWVWNYSNELDAAVQMTDDGFQFYLSDGVDESFRTAIKNLNHLQQLINGYENQLAVA